MGKQNYHLGPQADRSGPARCARPHPHPALHLMQRRPRHLLPEEGIAAPPHPEPVEGRGEGRGEGPLIQQTHLTALRARRLRCRSGSRRQEGLQSRDAQSHVAELDLGLVLQTHQRAVGENEDDDAGRQIGLLRRGSRRPTFSSASEVLRGRDAKLLFKTRSNLSTLATRSSGPFGADPVVAHASDDEAALPRHPPCQRA